MSEIYVNYISLRACNIGEKGRLSKITLYLSEHRAPTETDNRASNSVLLVGTQSPKN